MAQKIYTTANTTFTAVATYQYRENYGTAERPYFKNKGGHDIVIADGLTHEMIADKGMMDRLIEMACNHPHAEINDYVEYWFRGIEFVPSTLWLDIRLINADHHYDFSELNLWRPDFEFHNAVAEYGPFDTEPEPFERFENLAEQVGQ